MTEEQWKTIDDYLRRVVIGVKEIHPDTATIIEAYRAEHERMRRFIRNLADESRVYLESEDD